MAKQWTGPELKRCDRCGGHFTAAECPVCPPESRQMAHSEPPPPPERDRSKWNKTWEEKRNEIPIHHQISDTGTERHDAPALERTTTREETRMGRVRVRFTGYRVRPIDPDGFSGSCKGILDFLHRSGLIEGDEPWRIIFETDQVRVKHFTEEKTEIVIDYPE